MGIVSTDKLRMLYPYGDGRVSFATSLHPDVKVKLDLLLGGKTGKGGAGSPAIGLGIEMLCAVMNGGIGTGSLAYELLDISTNPEDVAKGLYKLYSDVQSILNIASETP